MRLTKRQPSGREKDQEAIELLEKLREQLHFSNLTVMRQTAYHLSWLQEDGFEILEEAILTNGSCRKTRTAAAYGLRKMRGRMRKPARELLESGISHSNPAIAVICKHAVDVLNNKHTPYKRFNRRRSQRPRPEIRDNAPLGNRRNASPRRFSRPPSR